MKSFFSVLGIVVGSAASLAGAVWTLMLAWGIWHGGTLKGVHWHVGPSPLLAIVVFLAGWELVAGLCFIVGSFPFLGISALIPEKKSA